MSNPERWSGFKPLPPDIEQKLERLIPLFEQTSVQLAYLFGSLSRSGAGHDVDLALISKDKPVFEFRELITTCLETERVDLVDLHRASPVLRFEIVRDGRLIYAASAQIEERFVMSTLREYKDTAWLRRHQETFLRERMKQWSSEPGPSNSG